MLYRYKSEPELRDELFHQPPSEYRGTPFWSWNCNITKELIDHQLKVFHQMGFGGTHIHPRTGLQTPYMGEEYLDMVKHACNKAKELGMLTWLYDEDRYPSGAAGGIVTEHMEYRSRHMVLSTRKLPEMCSNKEEFQQEIKAGNKPSGYFITAYRILLQDNYLSSYQRLSEDIELVEKRIKCKRLEGKELEGKELANKELDEKKLEEQEEGSIWYAYLRLAEESAWFNDQTYLNALNKEAVERFIEVTHQRYYEVLGDEFGKAIPAIFTDEPHVKGKMAHPFARSQEAITLSYTDNFTETYIARYGVDFLDVVPEILWELPESEVSIHRYQYHDHLTERFVSAYCDTLGEWCEKHRISLTGHFLSERSLYSQLLALGEAMRCYRSFQLPGIDILCDQKELSTAKQAVSVARQYGREGVISELYGATHWDFGFKGHKLQGDWQAALGITIRTPHLAFMSMEGEAKRDWPASISYQSPWYEVYSYIENHFARVNTALTRGKAIVKVGVIHPIESFWISYGPIDQTQTVRDQLDANFENLMQWLLYGMVDFDLISEALLPDLCADYGAPLKVGAMEYDTILVPDLRIMRSTTLERLEAFAAEGGKVVFAGRIPQYVDGRRSERCRALAEKSHRISYNREELLKVLKDDRLLEIRYHNGKLSDNLFYQLRQDENCKWLFVCHVNQKKNKVDEGEDYTLRIRGEYQIYCYDTIKGQITKLETAYSDGDTLLQQRLYGEDSLLLKLVSPASMEAEAELDDSGEKDLSDTMALSDTEAFSDSKGNTPGYSILTTLYHPVAFNRSEPNVLLLDYAKYRLNDGDLQERNEILRIDNELRSRLGYPRRQDAFKQPYRIAEEGRSKDLVTLYYEFESELEVENVLLAVERPENMEIFLNHCKVPSVSVGYYVDTFLPTVRLPNLRKGINQLELQLPFGRKTNLEVIYLLGDFGVQLKGQTALITQAPKELELGDITRQGLPFYTGNITYQFEFEASGGKEVEIAIPHYSSPVLSVRLDKEEKGLIAFAPHRLNLGHLSKGFHHLEILLYGNRFNGFGTLHNCNSDYMWYGPDSYRTEGSEWSESYHVKPVGILSRIEVYER